LLVEGSLELQSLAGRKRFVSLAQVGPYEVSQEEAAHHIKARVQGTAEKAVRGVLDVLGAFDKRGRDPGGSDLPGGSSDQVPPNGSGLEVLAELAGVPAEQLREDPSVLWSAVKTVGERVRDVYVGATRGDEAALEQARREAASLQQTLSQHGVRLTRDGGNIADQLRAAQPVLAEARAETAARFEHAAVKIHAFLRGTEAVLRDAAKDVRAKGEHLVNENPNHPDTKQGS
jgi:hypothetical protein